MSESHSQILIHLQPCRPFLRQLRRFTCQLVLSLMVISCFSGSAVSQEKEKSNGFVHPGLLHTQQDLERMRDAINNENSPISDGFKVLQESKYSQHNYQLRGPSVEWGRAPNVAMGQAVDDATAAYQNALMWCITGNKKHADKAAEILNRWSTTHQRMVGVDGVLAAGLQGLKFVNAAELLRHTDSGWPEEQAVQCERWFRNAIYPKIEHYAYFANGNWETAALQTNVAIAVYCSDREMFESTMRYAVNGCGNGSIPNVVIDESGQCQETTRAQHYAQLGLGTLANAVEIAWNQGVDLYGWNNNRLMQGFEYTAKYGLGHDVPYRHYLDRTGKYGLEGRHQHYTKISTVSRGNFYAIFERPYNHYAKRRKLSVPFSEQVVERKRPEGFNHDHVGLGTLTHFRDPPTGEEPLTPPGVPSGLIGRSLEKGIRLSWVRSVAPVSCKDAQNYTVYRSTMPDRPFSRVASVTTPAWVDRDVARGQLYRYQVVAHNEAGSSSPSAVLSISAQLPAPWLSKDIGEVGVAGFAEYDGTRFTLEGEGHDIGGSQDSFHYVYAPMEGQGTVTARIVRPMSSQWTKPGVMIRETLEADSRHASVLLLPIDWSAALVSRGEAGGETQIHGKTALGEAHIEKGNRLMTPYWVRLIRFRNRFTGYISPDGHDWREIGSVKIPMGHRFFVGLPACSQLKNVTTTVTYDRVSIPTWRQTMENHLILSRPEPRWHREPWFKRHQAMNDRVQKGDVDLIMIGDSITHWFDREGKAVWDQHYGDRAVNLAISGDRTEHVLWRLENGNLENIAPKIATVMIGTNNHMSSPPQVTARDIGLIVQTLRHKLPTTQVLVLAIFPRGAGPEDGARKINEQVNQLVEKQIASLNDPMVNFANINRSFFSNPETGRLNQDAFPDGTHPNEKGYQIWAEALDSILKGLRSD